MQAGVDLVLMLGEPDRDRFGDFLKGVQVLAGIPVAQFVVSDDVDSPLQKEGEVFKKVRFHKRKMDPMAAFVEKL